MTHLHRLRRLVALFAVSSLIVSSLPAAAHEPPEIVFPVLADTQYVDSFGDPRPGGRSHEGTDIMTPAKGDPVVAVADGVVTWIDDECCHLAIDHGGGWTSWYIHLNNDTPGTDDGLGWGIAEGITEGTVVTAGQLIGWAGDSGNAEATAPQLHFELRSNGTAINPYPYLIAAPLPVTSTPDFAGAFRDDDGSVHETDIDYLYDLGITRGCGQDLYCPDSNVTRGEIAAFLRRHLDLPAAPTDYYHDDDASIFQEDINALTHAGIAFGCGPETFCPDTDLRRDEMAELMARTFATSNPDRYANPDGTDWFTDDADSPHQDAINRLRAAAVTNGCDPADPLRFCPDRPLTRAEMASFLARALR